MVRANYFAFGCPPDLFDGDELKYGIHGGEVETSLMLHLHPDLVNPSALENFTGLTHDMARRNRLLGPEKPVGFGWMSQDLNPQGVSGNAARADAQRGALLLNYLAEKLAVLVEEIRTTPLSTLRPGPLRQ